jgi:hypothetical protein
MLDDRCTRKVEKLIEGEGVPISFWSPIEFEELKKGDIWRMFESDGTPVVGHDKKSTVFKANGNPYINEINVWTIESELVR